jgi:hypothetical protein
MKVGYFFNGYLSDKLSENSKDSPDGNAWYSSSIIEEILSRGDEVYLLGVDKDKVEYKEYKSNIFNSFEKKKRIFTYKNSKKVKWKFNKSGCLIKENIDFDLILLEWRFPIPGRNTIDDIKKQGFQYDLLMQEYILEKYDCPIIIFDLDYKLTIEDEQKLKDKKNITIFETAVKPIQRILPRVSIDIPFWMSSRIIQNKEISKYKDIVYIGSRYERDRSIQEYLIPYSNKELFKVWFYGNWRKYPDKYDELYFEMNWKNIQYHNRIGHSEFKQIYSDSLCCPLRAKDEYYKNGFMTARIQECLYFGSIPIGFKEHYGIEKYLPESLIALNSEDFYNKVQQLKKLTIKERNIFRQQLWDNLEFMDVKYFVNEIIKVIK